MEKSVFDLEEQNSNISSKIVVALEKVAEGFRVLLWEQAKASGLSPIQIQLLIFIKTHREEFCKVSYLATEFNLTKATVSDAVRVLNEKGIIAKVKNPNDTRSTLLSLTEEGDKMTDKFMLFSNGIKTRLEKLPGSEQESLWNSLSFLLSGLSESGTISMQRMCFQCQYYEKRSEGHFCKFLSKTLKDSEVRIDCPEHQPVK